MQGIRVVTGAPRGAGLRIAIVAARWNSFIVDKLVRGALDALLAHGVAADAITLVKVAGAFEIPLLVKTLAASGEQDAVIALGAVIRGDTPHFEFVAGECARGLTLASLETGIPVAFGVLTVDTLEQAVARSGDGEDNKGAEAAVTVLESIAVLRELGAPHHE